MKALPALLSAMAVVMLASCASPIQRRIERNPEIYSKLSERHKALVSRGQIEEGMSKQAVFIAWGRPDRVYKGSRSGRSLEHWGYVAYDAVPVGYPGIGMGYGIGYGGWYGRGLYYDPFYYYQPMISYVPYEGAKVEFTNAKVSAWQR